MKHKRIFKHFVMETGVNTAEQYFDNKLFYERRQRIFFLTEKASQKRQA